MAPARTQRAAAARFLRGAIAGMVLGGSGGVLAADPSAPLIGSWDLVSLENRGADGSIRKPFGDHPVGRITYTPDGFMSAQIMHESRPAFATAELYGGSPAEKATAYDGYIAYYGTFAVDPVQHTLTHHVTGSLFPNWVGGDQVRFYTLETPDTLVLTTRPFQAQGTEVTAHVVWRRNPGNAAR